MTTQRTEHVAKLAELIKGIKIAMLTTTAPDGTLHSRPLATQQQEFDGDLWFFIGEHSAMASQIATHHHVNLSYADPSDHRYVSVSGTAQLVHDRAKFTELWSPAYKAWFPKGLDDPELALLQINVQQAEYWDSPSNAMVHLLGFVKAMATGQRYEGGENEKLELGR